MMLMTSQNHSMLGVGFWVSTPEVAAILGAWAHWCYQDHLDEAAFGANDRCETPSVAVRIASGSVCNCGAVVWVPWFGR